MKVYRLTDGVKCLLKQPTGSWDDAHVRSYKSFWTDVFGDSYDSLVLLLNEIYICQSHEQFVTDHLNIYDEYPDNFIKALDAGSVFVDVEKDQNCKPKNIFYSSSNGVLKFQYNFLEMMCVVFECCLFMVKPEYRKFTIKHKTPIHMYPKAGTVLEDCSDVTLKYSPPGDYNNTFM